jgi:CheY-like chemotaxis protein
LEVGADAYIVKQAFDEGQLLAAVERVMGAAA